jgi:ribosome-binding factor A
VQVNRSDRLSEEIRSEISDIIPTLKDPRVKGIVSITRVSASRDCRHAKVFVSVLGSESELSEVVRGLKSSAGYIRRELAARMSLRYTPELSFEADAGIVRARRTLDVLKDLVDSDKSDKEEDHAGK